MLSLFGHQLRQELLPDLANQRIVKLTTNLKLAQLQSSLGELLSEAQLRKKDSTEGYSGVCLQYREGESKYYGALNHEFDRPRREALIAKADVKNSLANYFQEVFLEFPNIQLKRGRLLRAQPGLEHKAHSDGPGSWKLHIPINSAPEAKFHYKDSHYHLKADGSAYLVNTSPVHWVTNTSKIPRDHLIFELVSA